MSENSILYNMQRQFGENITQRYPLFLGERMGLHDVVDTTYPEIEKLVLLQRSQFWTETEVDLSKDVQQWDSLSTNEQDVSILNLAWQSQADTIAGRAPLLALLPLVTNPEMEELVNWWQTFEQIHTRSYQHIIRTVFPDPERVRDSVAMNEKAQKRLGILADCFEELHYISAQFTLDSYDGNPYKTYSKNAVQLAIIRALASLYALESIQFFCSFACTFALAELGIMTGISDILRLIAKDEALHTRFTHAIISILRKDPEWADLVEQVLQNEFHAIMGAVEDLESDWADYLFSEGRSILGLNAESLKDYGAYLRGGAVRALGLPPIEGRPIVDRNPLPWINQYLDPSMIQVAPQERDVTNYRVGSVDGNVGDLEEFDDL